MKQINICVNGRDYLLNCAEGEEARLGKVTDYLSSQIARLDRGTKRSGDTNLMLTAALLVSDEVLTLRDEIMALRHDIKQVRLSERVKSKYWEENDAELASTLAQLAQRINRLAETMSQDEVDKSPDNLFTVRDAAEPAA